MSSEDLIGFIWSKNLWYEEGVVATRWLLHRTG